MRTIHRLLQLAVAVMVTSGISAADLPVSVVTGNTIVQDIATQIGGERIQVTCLLRPGIDPHSYQPVPADVQRLAGARLVIINGLGFEGWFEGLAKESGCTATVIIASRGITPLKMAGEDGQHVQVDDPHAFNAITNGVRYAENIRDALIATDGAGAEGYQSRAATYIAALRQADALAKKQFASLAKAQRKLVTNHDALQYFAREYGFEILAPNTALEDSQPSAKDLAELVDFIKRQGVKGVFLEFGKNEKIIQQVATEAGVTVGAELYLDGVGPVGSPAATYIGMFRHNVTSIITGLRGTP